MNRIQLETNSNNLSASRASNGQPSAESQASSDIKDLANSLRGELQSLKSNRETIAALLTSRSQNNSGTSIDDTDKFRSLRKQAKDLQKQTDVGPEQLETLKDDYKDLMASQEDMDKPYLRPFVAFMDKQIQELEAKMLFAHTPDQVFAMNETGNQALAMMDKAGSSLNLDNLDPDALANMSKTSSKMRSDFERHSLKLFPDLADAYAGIDRQASAAADPQKAQFDFSLAMKPIEMANQMTQINDAEGRGDYAAAAETSTALKTNMVDYYDRISNFDESLKLKASKGTDAD